MRLPRALTALLMICVAGTAVADEPSPALRGTGDMGLVIERASGSVLVVETTSRSALGRIGELGDLSHASAVFSRDQRYAYVFGRDGGLTKIDLLRQAVDKRIIQAGNSIGGAISQDGAVIGVANYEPGGVRLFDAGTLDLISDIPAAYGDDGALSKVIGLVDAPGKRFVFSLYDAGQIWVANAADPARPTLRRYAGVGKLPYDGIVTPDGRFYIAGLFGEDGVALLDLWNEAVEAAPAFHDLVLKAVRAAIMRDGVIEQVETAWLKQLFAKHFGDRERQFLDDLRIHAQRKCPEFEEYCRHMLGA